MQEVVRQERKFNSAPVPLKLQASLPYASKPKLAKKRKSKSYLEKRAVPMEPDEKRKHTLLRMVNTMRNDKLQKRKEKQAERTAKLQKKLAKVQEFFQPHHQEERKRKFATRDAAAARAQRKQARLADK